MKCLIKDIRKSKGIIQSYVAKEIGVTQQVLSKWEKGNAYPRIDHAFKLAKVLGVSVYDLYECE